MIPQDTVNRILDAVRIEDIVGDFMTLKRRGASFVACCPFHNEKTPSFYVTPSKGIFKCFGCGESGTAVGFLMKHENLSYADALRFIARKYGIEVVEKEESQEEVAARQRSESLMLVSEFAEKFFVESLDTQEGRTCARAYFKSRGMTDETVSEFGLGWAPSSRTALADAALKAGYKEEYLVEAGLCIKYDDGRLVDRFHSRAMFPIHSVGGRVIAYSGRTLRSDKEVAKYVNSPESPIYIKSRSLYGIALAKKEISRQDRCYLVEGNVDVVSMHQLGILNVVASCGTALTPEQVHLIHKFTDNVTIMYDGDKAGIKAALKGVGTVLEEGLNVKVVLLPDGQDPDDFCRKNTLEQVRAYIEDHERDFITFKTELLLNESENDPLRRASVINDIADTIALIPDSVKRAVFIQNCSDVFKIDRNLLSSRISESRKKTAENLKKAESREAARVERRKETVPMAVEKERNPDSGITDKELEPAERALLQLVLRHGCDPLYFDKDSRYKDAIGEPVFVFVDSVLCSDGVRLSNDIYGRIYELYGKLFDEGLSNDEIINRMMNDADRELAETVTDFSVDRHELTIELLRNSMTTMGTQLVRYVPESLLRYQLARVDKENAILQRQLTSGELSCESKRELIGKISANNRIRNSLCKTLNIAK